MSSYLKTWLLDQRLSVRQLADGLNLPLKTVQGWVYGRYMPSPENQEKLDAFIACTHHWAIDRPAGPISKGVCKKCGETRQFSNSVEYSIIQKH